VFREKVRKFGKCVTVIKFQSGRYTVKNEISPDQEGEENSTIACLICQYLLGNDVSLARYWDMP